MQTAAYWYFVLVVVVVSLYGSYESNFFMLSVAFVLL